MSNPEIIALLGAIGTGLAAIAAFGVWYYSNKTNKQADEANKIATKANELATEAIELATKANELSSMQYEGNFPHFEAVFIKHIKKVKEEQKEKVNFTAYSNPPKSGYENLNSDLRDLLDKTRNQLTYQLIGEQEYLLINIIQEKDSLDNVQLYLGIIDAEFVNVLRPASCFRIIKSHSILINEEKPIQLNVSKNLSLPIVRNKDGQHIHVKIAYAHTSRGTPSIMTDLFVQAKEDISFLGAENYKNAKAYFNFTDSALRTVVTDSALYPQERTVHIKMDATTGKVDLVFSKDWPFS
jgi:hypothetical protein